MKKTERQYYEVELAAIVAAAENLRDTAPRLSKLGYGVFKPEKQQQALVSLALSGDAQQQSEYVKLIDENEAGIKELADNMATTGQLEPIRVRPTDEKGKFDLVFGARRMLARLYIHAKSGGKVPARLTAEVVEQEDQDALYASISENIRAEPSPMDDARNYDRLKKTFGMTPKEIGLAMGKSPKVIQSRLRLMRLPKDVQEKVHLGKIGVERALKQLEGKDGLEEPAARKAPSIKLLEQCYSAPAEELPDEIRPLITEEVRKLLAHWLGVPYQPRQQEQSGSSSEQP